MSHVFDTGLADAQRTLLVNAMITKLTPLMAPGLGGSAAGFLEAIVPISFGIESKHDLVELDLLSAVTGGKAPAIAIFPGTLKPGQAGGIGKGRGDLHVDIFFVSQHRRDLTEGRATMDAIATADDTADPGIFATLELVWALLFDCDLGLGGQFAQLKLASEGELSTDVERTVWKQEWTIAISRDANMYRGLTQKFTNAHTVLKQSQPTDEPTNKQIVEDTTVG